MLEHAAPHLKAQLVVEWCTGARVSSVLHHCRLCDVILVPGRGQITFHHAFCQADKKIIPQHAVSEIADAVVADCRALLSVEDRALVLQRLSGALRGFVASDAH